MKKFVNRFIFFATLDLWNINSFISHNELARISLIVIVNGDVNDDENVNNS